MTFPPQILIFCAVCFPLFSDTACESRRRFIDCLPRSAVAVRFPPRACASATRRVRRCCAGVGSAVSRPASSRTIRSPPRATATSLPARRTWGNRRCRDRTARDHEYTYIIFHLYNVYDKYSI